MSALESLSDQSSSVSVEVGRDDLSDVPGEPVDRRLAARPDAEDASVVPQDARATGTHAGSSRPPSTCGIRARLGSPRSPKCSRSEAKTSRISSRSSGSAKSSSSQSLQSTGRTGRPCGRSIRAVAEISALRLPAEAAMSGISVPENGRAAGGFLDPRRVRQVIPCLNEAESIEACVGAARKALEGRATAAARSHGRTSNGSTRRQRRARGRHAGRAASSPSRRRGYGNAYLAGLAAARRALHRDARAPT